MDYRIIKGKNDKFLGITGVSWIIWCKCGTNPCFVVEPAFVERDGCAPVMGGDMTNGLPGT